jgi:tetratricopeptide (TPR) repeat protein
MAEQHASPETIRLFLGSQLSAEETSVLIHHLLSHCPQCLRAAGALAWRAPQPMLPAFRQANHRRGYGEAFAVTERRLAVRERELTRQRAVAGDQWQELRRHPPLRRRWRIRNDPRFGTWGFCERLLHECLALGRRDPRQANELAELGVEAVARLETDLYGAGRVADMEALAWGTLGEMHRLQLALPAAAEALARARAAFERGTGDLLEQARLVKLEMALATDRGELETAAAALGWAAGVYRRFGSEHREGIALLFQAKAVGLRDPEQGLALLDRALQKADRGQSWIELFGRHHRIWFLDASGRSRQAAMQLAGCRHLYRPFGDLRTKIALRWLEGRIARSLGDLDAAETAFTRLQPVLEERGLRFHLGRLSLDLAAVHAARGAASGCGVTMQSCDRSVTNEAA